MASPLDGIHVVDFTEYIAGPYATMMLADMGADVVKIERPTGDTWRHTAPVAEYESRGFLGVNRSKRSVSLNLEQAEGKEIAQRLAVEADVVVANYRPGVAERLGLDYRTLSERNPALIYAENTAYGSKGPYSGRAGFDILSQAATGMILYENKMERGVPQFISTSAIADLTTGMFMAYAIVNALYARKDSGKGQLIETSLFASGLAAQYRPLLSVDDKDKAPREGFLQELEGARKDGISFEEALSLKSEYIPGRGRNNYYRIYETKDGLMAVACLNNRLRRNLRDALGVEDPSVDGMGYDWFAEEVRVAHRKAVEHFENGFRERTTDEMLALLDAADVPCSRVNFPEEMYENEHVHANDLMLDLDHPVVGNLRMPASPIRMSDTPVSKPTPPPVLGADGPDVMRELGMSDDDIERLLDAGVLVTRERLLGEN
jgi:crotonobetainyl-CoA:carnitine CoA-transferase CaiB-like acyl-CoA transferase